MPNFSSDPDAYGVPSPEERNTPRARIDAAIAEMHEDTRKAAEEAQRELDLMTEARTRFAKAALYEQIIEGQLFEGDDAVTLAVEDEFKAFAEERLMVLLGMQPDRKKSDASFDDEEVNVLKLFAAKMLKRDISIPTKTTAPATLAPVRVAKPAPPSVGALAAPKRPRGRPPGTGKNQRAAAAAQAPMRAPRQDLPVTKMVTLPNGEVKQTQVQPVQVKPSMAAPGPKPLPMPSPDEMVANAMVVGDAGLRKSESKFINPPLD
jgi:hypothetical protein